MTMHRTRSLQRTARPPFCRFVAEWPAAAELRVMRNLILLLPLLLAGCTQPKRIGFWSGLAVAAYLILYFSSVQPVLFKRAGPAIPIPSYAWPSDGEFIHAVFAPAHLIDAAFLRRGYWAPKETSPNPAAAL